MRYRINGWAASTVVVIRYFAAHGARLSGRLPLSSLKLYTQISRTLWNPEVQCRIHKGQTVRKVTVVFIQTVHTDIQNTVEPGGSVQLFLLAPTLKSLPTLSSPSGLFSVGVPVTFFKI